MNIKRLAEDVRNHGEKNLATSWQDYDDLSFCEGIQALLNAIVKIEDSSKNAFDFKGKLTELIKELAVNYADEQKTFIADRFQEAREEAYQKGIEEGYEKGREEGYEKGMEEGYEKSREGEQEFTPEEWDEVIEEADKED